MLRLWSVKRSKSMSFPDPRKCKFSNSSDRARRAKMKQSEAKNVRKTLRGLGRHG